MNRKISIIGFATIITLLYSCVKDNNIDGYSLTIDDTNYNSYTLPVFQKYNSNPIAYFAEHGFIALTIQHDILLAVGHQPRLAFKLMIDSFDVAKATNAKNTNLWAPNFINKMNEKAAEPILEQWLHAMMFFARQTHQIRLNNPSDPNLGNLYSFLGEGIRHGIKQGLITILTPPMTSPPSYNITIYNELCICEMFASPSCNTKDSSENNSTAKQKWWKVENPFKTSSNGECATLSTGLCMHKLGLTDSLVDGKEWNEVSKEIQALKRGGAFNENISAYFDRLGYGVTKTSDIRDAYLALNRGCDVKIVYHDGSIIRGKQHIEYITHIKLDSPSQNQGTVHTISWGDSSNVKYNNGQFSNKSDGANYGNEDFLNKNGNSHFLIYCKK